MMSSVNPTKHVCHAAGCEKSVPPKLLMCAPHWRLLPAPARRIIWHHYRPGQERDKNPSSRYLLAQAVAVALVAFIERIWSARQALDHIARACLLAARAGVSADGIEEMLRAMGCERISEGKVRA